VLLHIYVFFTLKGASSGFFERKKSKEPCAAHEKARREGGPGRAKRAFG